MSDDVVAVTIPAVGVAMTEAAILRWLVAVGDLVAEGQHVAEIETDKVVMELESPASGVIDEILIEPGINVEVNVPIATIRVGSGNAPSSGESLRQNDVMMPTPGASGGISTTPSIATAAIVPEARLPAVPVAQPSDTMAPAISAKRKPFADPPRVRFADRRDSHAASAAPIAATRAGGLLTLVAPSEGAPSWTATSQMSASGLKRKLHASRTSHSGTVVTYTDLLISLIARAAVHTFIDRTVTTGVAAFGAEPGALEYREVTDAASLSPEAIWRSRYQDPDALRPATSPDALHLLIVNSGPDGPDVVVPPAPTSASVIIVGIGSIAPRIIAIGGGVAIRTTVHLTICAQLDRTTAHQITRFASTIREKLND